MVAVGVGAYRSYCCFACLVLWLLSVFMSNHVVVVGADFIADIVVLLAYLCGSCFCLRVYFCDCCYLLFLFIVVVCCWSWCLLLWLML